MNRLRGASAPEFPHPRTSRAPWLALGGMLWLSTTAGTAAQEPADALPAGPWSPLAFDPESTDYEGLVERVAEGARDSFHLPGLTVAVMVGDTLRLERGYGFANLEHDVPATADTVYRIGSVTKQFTAASILQLVEGGKLALDEDVAARLPWFEADGAVVTVDQLLRHTSGLPNYTDVDFGLRWMSQAREDVKHEQLFALVAERPLDFAPGSDWSYSNTGYVLLGALLDEVGRHPPRRYLRRKIADPLELASLQYDNHRNLTPGRASGYTWMGQGHLNCEFLSMTQPDAAGAMVAVARDLLRWQRALFGGAVLGPATLESMVTATELPDGRSTGYGAGLAIGRLNGLLRWSHGGGIHGFSSALAYYPEVELGVCVLTNLEGAPAVVVERSVTRNLLGLGPPLDLDLPTEAALRQAAVGHFRFVGFETELLDRDGRLWARLAGQPDHALEAKGEDCFGIDGVDDFLLRLEPAAGDSRIQAVWIQQNGNDLRGVRSG
jgi:D-alanyl-D-alanine carboxypeptidase